MHGEACLARPTAMIAPLRCQYGGKLRVVGDFIDDLLGRSGAPFGNRVAVPPIEHVSREFRHRAGREDLEHGLPAFAKRVGPRLDRLSLIGVTILQIALLSFVGAGKGHRLGRTNVHVVVDRSQGSEIYRRIGNPVEQITQTISRGYAA